MSGYYWTLRTKRKAYNPDQPRVPAGNSEGGRWTSSGGGISTAIIPKTRTTIQQQQIDKLRQEVETWTDEGRKWGADSALVYPGDVIVMKDGDELIGVANVANRPVATSGAWAGMYEANYLGTKRPGYGKKMVDKIKQHIIDQGGRGYYAYFAEDALPFHLASGMKLREEPGDRIVYWMAEWGK